MRSETKIIYLFFVIKTQLTGAYSPSRSQRIKHPLATKSQALVHVLQNRHAISCHRPLGVARVLSPLMQIAAVSDKLQKDHSFVVPSHLEGSRLDEAVHTMLPELSRSQCSSLCQEGRVFVDAKACTKKSAKVEAGSEIVVKSEVQVSAGSEASALGEPETLSQKSLKGLFDDLPVMSRDGGSQREFIKHWSYWKHPRSVGGGWIERRVHPQIAIANEPTPYWYHRESGRYAFEKPSEAVGPREAGDIGDPPPLNDDSPVWGMSCAELKAALSTPGEAARLGLTSEDLARRAVFEYESWNPRVQSWHDYADHTFWFLSQGASNNDRSLYADDEFYHALASLAVQRLKYIHPISLAYMTWTFSRPQVIIPEFLKAVGDHLVDDGLIPLLDRCGLYTLIWAYWKMRTKHERFFHAAATETKRPMRLRSIAPRNFQNAMIGFSRMGYDDAELYNCLATGTARICDEHTEVGPKLPAEIVFPYTCINGKRVDVDSFRISSLTVIAQAFLDCGARGLDVDRCFVAMDDYVRRSKAKSPSMMREPGDVQKFSQKILDYKSDKSQRSIPDGWPTFNSAVKAQFQTWVTDDANRIKRMTTGSEEQRKETMRIMAWQFHKTLS